MYEIGVCVVMSRVTNFFGVLELAGPRFEPRSKEPHTQEPRF
jgi:hypothetical protein